MCVGMWLCFHAVFSLLHSIYAPTGPNPIARPIHIADILVDDNSFSKIDIIASSIFASLAEVTLSRVSLGLDYDEYWLSHRVNNADQSDATSDIVVSSLDFENNVTLVKRAFAMARVGGVVVVCVSGRSARDWSIDEDTAHQWAEALDIPEVSEPRSRVSVLVSAVMRSGEVIMMFLKTAIANDVDGETANAGSDTEAGLEDYTSQLGAYLGQVELLTRASLHRFREVTGLQQEEDALFSSREERDNLLQQLPPEFLIGDAAAQLLRATEQQERKVCQRVCAGAASVPSACSRAVPSTNLAFRHSAVPVQLDLSHTDPRSGAAVACTVAVELLIRSEDMSSRGRRMRTVRAAVAELGISDANAALYDEVLDQMDSVAGLGLGSNHLPVSEAIVSTTSLSVDLSAIVPVVEVAVGEEKEEERRRRAWLYFKRDVGGGSAGSGGGSLCTLPLKGSATTTTTAVAEAVVTIPAVTLFGTYNGSSEAILRVIRDGRAWRQASVRAQCSDRVHLLLELAAAVTQSALESCVAEVVAKCIAHAMEQIRLLEIVYSTGSAPPTEAQAKRMSAPLALNFTHALCLEPVFCSHMVEFRRRALIWQQIPTDPQIELLSQYFAVQAHELVTYTDNSHLGLSDDSVYPYEHPWKHHDVLYPPHVSRTGASVGTDEGPDSGYSHLPVLSHSAEMQGACEGSRFLVYEQRADLFGIGSLVTTLGVMLRFAMCHNRTLILSSGHESQLLRRWRFPGCATNTFECYFMPLSSCILPPDLVDAAPVSVNGADLDTFGKSSARVVRMVGLPQIGVCGLCKEPWGVPLSVRRDGVDIDSGGDIRMFDGLPTGEKGLDAFRRTNIRWFPYHHFAGPYRGATKLPWLSSLVRLVLRPKPWFGTLLRQLVAGSLRRVDRDPVGAGAGAGDGVRRSANSGVGTDSDGLLSSPFISMHIRHGNKVAEKKSTEVEKYFQICRAKLPHIRAVFVSTETAELIPHIIENYPEYDIFYIDYSRIATMKVPEMEQWDYVHEFVFSFANLYLSVEADGFVGSLTSNWCTIIEYMQHTRGDGGAPYFSVDGAGSAFSDCY